MADGTSPSLPGGPSKAGGVAHALHWARALRDQVLPQATARRRWLDTSLERLARPILDRVALPGCLERACWIAEDTVLIAGWFVQLPGEALAISYRGDSALREMTAPCFAYARSDCPGSDRQAGKVLIVRGLLSDAPGWLSVNVAGRAFETPVAQVARRTAAPADWAAGLARVLDFEGRSALAHFLATHQLPENLDRANPTLRLIQQGLRVARPRWGGTTAERQAAHVDHFLLGDAHECLIAGWACDRDAPIARIFAISPDGLRIDLRDKLQWYRRSDVDDLFARTSGALIRPSAFAGCFHLPGPFGNAGWIVEFENERGKLTEAACPELLQEPGPVRHAILEVLRNTRDCEPSLLDKAIRPVVDALQTRVAADARIASLESFGSPPAAPTVSVIVPLFQRTDWVEHQLAQFADDPDLGRAELIYVLDSPELATALHRQMAQLCDLYRFPLRLAVLNRSCGFALANNLGASVARGRALLLCNSDVLPAGPGWLSRLLAFHDARAGIGAVGPKLLFENGSLQHAGMEFRRTPEGLWANRHRWKGLPRDWAPANVAEEVQALTGACLLIERDIYQGIGGLRGRFLMGDFEDSDLCLRLREIGRSIWYCPEVELYHLEGQSYPSPLRAAASRYNAWLHTQENHALIRQTVKRFGGTEE